MKTMTPARARWLHLRYAFLVLGFTAILGALIAGVVSGFTGCSTAPEREIRSVFFVKF